VIDSADDERLALAKAELDGMLMDGQLRDASLLVVLNKRDLPGVLTVEQLIETLDLEKSCQQSHRKFCVQPAIATTGEGLREGLTWLCENMTEL
jgi:signal recognition particle receptor subunit beta